MSILDPKFKDPKFYDDPKNAEKSQWLPTDAEIAVRSKILRDFATGYTVMNTPRQEFNGLSTVQRDSVDSMAFNTYQPNNGQSAPGDSVNGWRSNAIRPIERNKVISMAGHVGGRLGFLQVEAVTPENDPSVDGAMVVNTQLDWVRAKYFPEEWWLHAVLQSNVSPACIVHHEYREVRRKVKTTRKSEAEWNYDDRLDEDLSGFVGTIAPTDQVFIENIFEKDIQKQRFLIWRRVLSHSLLEAKYKGKKNWEHVREGMQFLFNDANQGFYFAYDSNLQGGLGEECLYWTKDGGGALITVVNGIVVGECDAKNPREDGLYPFAKWYFSWIRDNFFYGKSTVFAVSHDANIVNTLYPVLVDGAILDTMKPMGYVGKDVIGSDTVIPGLTTVMRDPNSKLFPLLPPMSTGTLMSALGEVEKSLDETQNSDAVPSSRRDMTAYEMGVREQQMARDLSPFMSELVGASVQLTRLVVGDIMQFCTVGDVDAAQGPAAALRYRSFVADVKGGKGKARKRKVQYEALPDSMTREETLAASFDLLERQGGMDSELELVKADPRRVRELKISMVVGDDVLRPKSDNLKFQENLLTLDKAIAVNAAQPGLVNMENAAKELLFSTNPVTARDPDSFINDQAAQQAAMAGAAGPAGTMPQQMPTALPTPAMAASVVR